MLSRIFSKRRVILITGCARSGTSLLTYLMKGFQDLDVHDLEEAEPRYVGKIARGGKPLVIKYPQGRVDAAKDFEKSHTDIFESEFVSDYAKKWKILICIRDGRDILTSHHPNKPNDYYVSPQRWKGAVQRALSLREHPNVLLVKYEHLVMSPQNQMSEISRFLNIPFDFDWIDCCHNQIEPNTQMSNALNGIRPIDKLSVGRWRSAEHAKRLAHVYRSHGEEINKLLAALGYETSQLSAA